jgi:hypothetical protein
MRPTHINITGRSKYILNHEIQPELRESRRFNKIIEKFSAGAILVLSDRVSSERDLQPLIDFMISRGISRGDIRVRYPNMDPIEVLQTTLSAGLAEISLSFGSDVAENDDGLARYFVTTPSYVAVQSRQKHVVIGPKGSGKSAILRELAIPSSECLVITPEHYTSDVLDALKKTSTGSDLAAYIATWKYTLLIEIFRRLVKNGSGDKAALTEMRNYLIAHQQLGGDLSLFERFVTYLRRITKIRGKVGPAEAELALDGAKELERLLKMDEVLGLIPALGRVLRRNSFTVFIDELDQSWNNSDTANSFLVALLTAAIQLRGTDPNLHIVVFLRSEIFDLLKPAIAQLDKLRSDIQPIHWSPQELVKLIVNRAFDSMNIDPEKSSGETAINTIFPGVMHPMDVSCFEYLLSRTSLRPREVIQFCNLSLKVAQQLNLQAIAPEAVLRAEEEFSGWKLEHIVSENLFIYPHLEVLLERFRGKSRRIDFKAMDSLLTDLILSMEEDCTVPEWLKSGVEPAILLDLLYRLEVIGIQRPTSEGYDFAFLRPQGKPERASSFQFHPGLWQALELV